MEPNFDPALVAALSALGGALVGALTSFAGIYLTQRQETARALRRELFSAATALWNRKYEYSRENGIPLLPLDDYLIDYLSLQGIIENSERLSDEELLDLIRKREARFKKISDYRFDSVSHPKSS